MSLLQLLDVFLHPLDQVRLIVEDDVVRCGASHDVILFYNLQLHLLRCCEDYERVISKFVVLGTLIRIFVVEKKSTCVTR